MSIVHAVNRKRRRGAQMAQGLQSWWRGLDGGLGGFTTRNGDQHWSQGKKKSFAYERERDVHDGYYKRGGGQPMIMLVTRGGVGGGKNGGEVVGNGERERTKGNVGWEEKQVGEAGFHHFLAWISLFLVNGIHPYL